MVSEFLALLARDATRGYLALVTQPAASWGTLRERIETERRARDAEIADAEPEPEPDTLPTPATPRDTLPSQIVFDIGTTLAAIEIGALLQTLRAVGGNRSKAARLLGIDRRTLHRRLNAYRRLNAAA